LVVVATLVYSLGALYSCALAFGDASAQPIVSVIVANSLLELAACGWLLLRFRDQRGGLPDIPRSGVAVVVIATVAALVTGLPALLLPQPVGHVLGYRVTDVIVLRLAGAATCGYAVMGALELRSRHWGEMRLPVLMAMVFNGAGLLATLVSLPDGGPILLPAVVLLATIIVTPAAAIALRRFGLTQIEGHLTTDGLSTTGSGTAVA
jgi:phosphotransferase system  glucose/maltose/N-acetylglucosamine-specific IIC component